MKRLPAGITALLLGLAVTTGAVAGETVVVEVRDYAYHPQEVTVHPGDTVRWVNKESRQYHSVWFKAEGGPKSEYFWPEESYQRTFEKPGDYPYECEPHGKSHNMRGVVHVVEE